MTLVELLDRPGFLELLLAKARTGIEVWIMVYDPDDYLLPLFDQPGITIMAVTSDERQTIHRSDDHMLVRLPLDGDPDATSPCCTSNAAATTDCLTDTAPTSTTSPPTTPNASTAKKTPRRALPRGRPGRGRGRGSAKAGRARCTAAAATQPVPVLSGPGPTAIAAAVGLHQAETRCLFPRVTGAALAP